MGSINKKDLYIVGQPQPNEMNKECIVNRVDVNAYAKEKVRHFDMSTCNADGIVNLNLYYCGDRQELINVNEYILPRIFEVDEELL